MTANIDPLVNVEVDDKNKLPDEGKVPVVNQTYAFLILKYPDKGN